ncbi:T9SS type A sorting domain-containing protein [Sabulilitoribacter arenilitoris]|uniref:T9SS type A sorting domain-containing protein n=1 Tax=Wocania arenilitoris TaxID=2044858 RepID=A0AAE3ESD3_9FLAO|nr:T9SS type A sorting domain-containing protein [Wocania arenilitoris]MCF7569464.1 T9SS type A sorting domain-containing protein [Wocania arenilitoris]
MKKKYLYLTALLFSTVTFSQSIILIDEFDGTQEYSTSGEYITSSTQYFGMTTETYADVELMATDFPFFGARQLSASPATITYNDLDITGKTNLTFAIGIAEDKGPGATEDWDADDSIVIEYRLDNGAWTTLFSIAGTGTDTAPQISSSDSNNGVQITNNVNEFDFGITTTTETEIDIRFTFTGLSDAEEDIVFEYLALVDNIDLLPEITISAPTTNFSNGVGTVDVTYTVAGNADSIDIIVNGGTPITGNNVNGDTVSIPVSDDTAYEVVILAYINGQEVGDNDVYFEVGTPQLSVAKDEIEGFSVYPNPVSNGEFFISTRENSVKNIGLYDVMGKMVLSKSIRNKESVDISNLNSGLYILKAEENGKKAISKLIVN